MPPLAVGDWLVGSRCLFRDIGVDCEPMKAAYQRKGIHLNFFLDDKLVEQVDEFRWKERLGSRKEAIARLLRVGLKAKPQARGEGKG